MKNIFKKNKGEEHDFWMSYTDLMSGFLIVFIIASLKTLFGSVIPVVFDLISYAGSGSDTSFPTDISSAEKRFSCSFKW